MVLKDIPYRDGRSFHVKCFKISAESYTIEPIMFFFSCDMCVCDF